MNVKTLNTAALVLGVAALSFMSACGQATDSSVKVGPSAQTSSGYQFYLILSPAVVKTGGSITVTGKLTLAGAAVTTGPTCYFSGDTTSGTATADTTTGICAASLTISGSSGSTGYVTLAVEDKSLSAAFQVKP